jgi:prevent-host-death family protein
MTRLTATEVARKFSQVVNRVGAGEEVEVVRNGVPIVQMRPARSHQIGRTLLRPCFDHRNRPYRYGDSNPGFWHEKPAS